MLERLFVKDYALIEVAEVEFRSGLNIITGETGAGKSILVGALGLIVGDRASTDVIRKGAKKSIVEGVFVIKEYPKVKELLDEFDIEFEDRIIIRREISLKGSNRVFVNDTPATLSQIKTLGNMLVDMHGQHEHQSLLSTEKHIDFLDTLGNYQKQLNSYKNLIDYLTTKKSELRKLLIREKELREKEELYRFQLKEIESVSPEDGEDVKLAEELKVLENAEHILSSANEIYSFVYDTEDSVYDKLSYLKKLISDLTRYDKKFAEQENEIDSALTSLSEVASFVREYGSEIEFDESALEEKRSRLGAINLLKKKYGGSLNSVLEKERELEDNLNLSLNFEREISSLKTEIEKIRKRAGEIAGIISEQRKKLALEIAPKVEAELKNLGMEDAKFEVRFSETLSTSDEFIPVAGKELKYDEKGIDTVEFFISTNQGEDLKPLARIASGGEISRVMLALKTILAEKDSIPLLIFDEIDVGISGRIAQKVAETMRKLGFTHQVIAISHLPQIAAFGNHHFVIVKENSNARVISRVHELSPEERITELAKLISGETVVTAAVEHAKELLKIAKQI
jgi:DNA repair protein RecN (Recombination protein N)